ncbi:hypothetical protein ACIROD_15940 [Peribacillus sp. NPDC101481]|uniref:hypothetical protein n=1 Tax=Peribacillus sp. NPDC101481 TaxID=3364403 RepID=UPI0037F43BBA
MAENHINAKNDYEKGMKYKDISNYLGFSGDTIRKVKGDIIGNIANKVKRDSFLQKLKSIKMAV